MAAVWHRAGWVMVEPDVWVERGIVGISAGRIVAVERSHTREAVRDHGPGIILPGLVNAHSHLSLSALAGRIDPSVGLLQWVRDLIRARDDLTPTEIETAAREAAQGAKNSGTALLAEVGPVEPGAESMRRAELEGIVMHEVLGSLVNEPLLPADSDGLTFSYAGHALHTTAPGLLQRAKFLSSVRGGLFSLHLAESSLEREFLANGRGEWADLLSSRGIDFSYWGPWGERPVARAARLGLLGPRTLVVHVLDVTRSDMTALAESGTAVCVCPRSNLALHGRLPDLVGLMAAGIEPALGTDSLASAPTLNLFDEMAFCADKYPELSSRAILRMATINGARALGRSDLGSLRSGSSARLIYVDVQARSADEAAQMLVSNQVNRVEWI